MGNRKGETGDFWDGRMAKKGSTKFRNFRPTSEKQGDLKDSKGKIRNGRKSTCVKKVESVSSDSDPDDPNSEELASRNRRRRPVDERGGKIQVAADTEFTEKDESSVRISPATEFNRSDGSVHFPPLNGSDRKTPTKAISVSTRFSEPDLAKFASACEVQSGPMDSPPGSLLLPPPSPKSPFPQFFSPGSLSPRTHGSKTLSPRGGAPGDSAPRTAFGAAATASLMSPTRQQVERKLWDSDGQSAQKVRTAASGSKSPRSRAGAGGSVTPSRSTDSFDGPSTNVFGVVTAASRAAAEATISHAIFQALFGQPKQRGAENCGRAQRLWDDVDSSDEDDEADSGGAGRQSVKLAAVDPVDEFWFKRLVSTSLLTSSALDFACSRVAMNREDGSESSGRDVLSQYISASFIHAVTKELSFEDERFPSPRVAVLKALYRNSSGSSIAIRVLIADALLESSTSRVERCRQTTSFARLLEAETNFVASRGLVGGLTGEGVGYRTQESIQAALAASMDSSGRKWGGGEERPGTRVRDSDSSLLELLKYLITVELSEAQAQAQARVLEMQQGRDGGVVVGPSVGAETDAETLRRLDHLHRVVASVLRCYGSGLGVLMAGESSADQPAVLQLLIQCTENLLQTALCITPPAPTSTPGRSIGQIICPLSEPSAALSWAVSVSTAAASGWLAERFLGTLLRLWPSVAGGGGGGFVQEVAFVKLTECCLKFALPPLSVPVPVPPSTFSSPLPHLSAKGVLSKCLAKVLSTLQSAHFKVALQALATIQNPAVLGRFFVDLDPAHCLATVVQTLSMRCFPISLPITSRTGSGSTGGSVVAMDEATFRRIVGGMQECRAEMLASLVHALRSNRNHWHPQVQGSSDALFNGLLDYLD